MSETTEALETEQQLSPKDIVGELNRHIIGQENAKRAVALALRTRWRRMQVEESLRNEINPKNILMIGPTGVGKTEIARRLSKLARAPFIKVEATKFTEIGYVGRDVESIIRDLAELAIKLFRELEFKRVETAAAQTAEERILDVLLRPARGSGLDSPANDESLEETKDSAREIFRNKLRNGELDDKEIDIDVSAPAIGFEIMSPPGMEEMTSQLQSIFSNLSSRSAKKTRRVNIKNAQKILKDEEAAKLINEEELKTKAIHAVEENGIVFIDEIDKITKRSDQSSTDISREGVQRDLLPLIEGSTVSTKHGMIKTDHILFICSGAFHLAKPSDLIPELQGRLPIRVELKPLTPADFERILTEPKASLTEQYKALLKTEGLDVEFAPDGIRRIAEIAYQVNEKTENIGARRLHTVLEKMLEEVSFDAETLAKSHQDTPLAIDHGFVDHALSELVQDEDLSRYIL